MAYRPLWGFTACWICWGRVACRRRRCIPDLLLTVPVCITLHGDHLPLTWVAMHWLNPHKPSSKDLCAFVVLFWFLVVSGALMDPKSCVLQGNMRQGGLHTYSCRVLRVVFNLHPLQPFDSV